MICAFFPTPKMTSLTNSDANRTMVHDCVEMMQNDPIVTSDMVDLPRLLLGSKAILFQAEIAYLTRTLEGLGSLLIYALRVFIRECWEWWHHF